MERAGWRPNGGAAPACRPVLEPAAARGGGGAACSSSDCSVSGSGPLSSFSSPSSSTSAAIIKIPSRLRPAADCTPLLAPTLVLVTALRVPFNPLPPVPLVLESLAPARPPKLPPSSSEERAEISLSPASRSIGGKSAALEVLAALGPVADDEPVVRERASGSSAELMRGRLGAGPGEAEGAARGGRLGESREQESR